MGQCLTIIFLVLKKNTFQCVVHNVEDGLIIVKAKYDDMMNLIPEKKHLRYITPLLEVFGGIFNNILESMLQHLKLVNSHSACKLPKKF